MPPRDDRISDEAARAIWRRAAQLEAEAQRRLEERNSQIAGQQDGASLDDGGFRPDEVRRAAEEAGIAPEFVQIALAEAAAAPDVVLATSRWDLRGAKFFLGATRGSIEVSTVVSGDVDTVSAASLQVFSGHPCLLETGEVADIGSSGRVLIFNVPKYDWGATANLPFVEKAYYIGLKQLHVAIRPLPEDVGQCEVVVAGDLRPGMRIGWRWTAGGSVGAGAVGATGGVLLGFEAIKLAGALLVFPALLGAVALGGSVVALSATLYRYYLKQAEEALKQSLQLLPRTARALAANQGGREFARRDLPPPTE